MLDKLKDWEADLHVCGRPLSESLHDYDKPADEQIRYAVGTTTCRACQALDRVQAERGRTPEEKAMREAGRNPESWRIDQVVPLDVKDNLLAGGQAAERQL